MRLQSNGRDLILDFEDALFLRKFPLEQEPAFRVIPRRVMSHARQDQPSIVLAALE
jgi:hypothetical protein